VLGIARQVFTFLLHFSFSFSPLHRFSYSLSPFPVPHYAETGKGETVKEGIRVVNEK